MKISRADRLAAVGLSLFTLAMGAAAWAADELMISSATSPQHFQTTTMVTFAKALEERSEGALTAKVFDSSQLYNARDVSKAVARGDVGMAIVLS